MQPYPACTRTGAATVAQYRKPASGLFSPLQGSEAGSFERNIQGPVRHRARLPHLQRVKLRWRVRPPQRGPGPSERPGPGVVSRSNEAEAQPQKTRGGSDGGSEPGPSVGHTLRDRTGAAHRPDGTSFTIVRRIPRPRKSREPVSGASRPDEWRPGRPRWRAPVARPRLPG